MGVYFIFYKLPYDTHMTQNKHFTKQNQIITALFVEAVTERNGDCMRYRIEYADERCCNFANSRKDLIEWLKLLKDESISDIRKVYKNGVTDSVKETYAKYIK